MDEELQERDECCNKEPSCEGPQDELCEGPVLTSINTTSTDLSFNDGCGVASSGTYHIHTGPVPIPMKMKDVIIKQMDYGFLVKIGCQTLCIESPKKLLKALKKYMKNPGAVEEQHMGGEFMENLD